MGKDKKKTRKEKEEQGEEQEEDSPLISADCFLPHCFFPTRHQTCELSIDSGADETL